MDGMNVKSLEERSEGDVASPSSTGTQVNVNNSCFPSTRLHFLTLVCNMLKETL